MTNNAGPLVSIGMPVFNGENFVSEALESIVGQSYENLQIVIGDNASTDATESICRGFAERDDRINYFRHSENLGASGNHDFVFFQSEGPMFKLAAHDDVLHPNLIERCVEALVSRPNHVLAFPRTRHIDADGIEHEAIDDNVIGMDSPSPALRLGRITCLPNWATPVFGVFRREAVKADTILGRYVGSDRTLLAELALAGPWHRVDEYMFYRREHETTSTNAFRSELNRMRWFDPAASRVGRFPNWRRLAEFGKAVQRAELTPRQRALAYTQLARWTVTPWYRPRVLKLLRDPIVAAMAAVQSEA
jgi:glycosyltransferase involved in cell wall biosynthesis